MKITLLWLLNSLRPSDAIWQQRSMSTLVQVMACCLMAPSHYLNQCWLIISGVKWRSSEVNFIRILKIQIHEVSLKIVLLTSFPLFLPGPNELKSSPLQPIHYFLFILQTLSSILLTISWITQTPVSGSCCLPLGALQSMWATWYKI